MMNQLQASKYSQVIAPAAIVDNASFTSNEIDTLDYDYLTVVFNLGATDIAMAALKLQSSDVSGSGFADVDGLDCDGDSDIDGNAAALPSADDDNNVIVFQVDLRGQKRYFDLVATAGDGAAGTFGSAVAILSKGAVSPVSSSDMGAETVLRV
jgi:hypothetical protein